MAINPPTPAELVKANMAAVPNLPVIVVESGDKVRVWNGKNFVVAPADTPYTTQLYAVPGSWIVEESEEPRLYLGGSSLGANEL